MLPVVAIIGRPNVGKSTLFNALSGSRAALVADRPGMTRDRHYRTARLGARRVVLIDTGGLDDDPDPVGRLIGEQSLRAVEEADLVVLLLDAREGLMPGDSDIAALLRRRGRPALAVVNKIDGVEPISASAPFHALGLGEPLAVSAAQRRGLTALTRALLARLPAAGPGEEVDERARRIRVAIVGRPNVGKSTLVNRLVGEPRVLAHDLPGTTRDTIDVPFSRDGRDYLLLDTAGIRRRSRVQGTAERLSVVRSLQAIGSAHVAVVVLDAHAGLGEQDLRLLGQVIEEGRACVVAVNKWDGLESGERRRVRGELERRLRFVEYATRCYCSALHGSGLGELLGAVAAAWEAATRKLATPELTRILAEAVEDSPPPLLHGRRIKLRYAHQGGSNPPRVVIHGNQTERLPEHYRRYLARRFREAFGLHGTPLVIELRSGENPFAGRRNRLTPRQLRHRRRLIRHARR